MCDSPPPQRTPSGCSAPPRPPRPQGVASARSSQASLSQRPQDLPFTACPGRVQLGSPGTRSLCLLWLLSPRFPRALPCREAARRAQHWGRGRHLFNRPGSPPLRGAGEGAPGLVPTKRGQPWLSAKLFKEPRPRGWGGRKPSEKAAPPLPTQGHSTQSLDTGCQPQLWENRQVPGHRCLQGQHLQARPSFQETQLGRARRPLGLAWSTRELGAGTPVATMGPDGLAKCPPQSRGVGAGRAEPEVSAGRCARPTCAP